MRTLLHGGTVLDARGSSVRAADITVENGRIVEVAIGLDGDEGLTAPA
jgi:dihydroorotase-like cyclic amidohydrolase